MEKTDISHEFEKAVMNNFIEHVVFSRDGAAFKNFVKTFCDATNADDEILVMNWRAESESELKNFGNECLGINVQWHYIDVQPALLNI